jgi:circadian clock protein KaiB
MNGKHVLRLYVTGQSQRSQTSIATLRQICEEQLEGRYELQIIDILENPQLAEDEKILATPTLIRALPEPMRRIIGDLSQVDRVLLGLDLLVHPSKGE